MTLRVLPAQLRHPISLAYLLARAGDTISDDPSLPETQRSRFLGEFKAQVISTHTSVQVVPVAMPGLENYIADNPDGLLPHLPKIFQILGQTSQVVKHDIIQIISTITEGLEMDLNLFPGPGDTNLTYLLDDNQLDRYTYLVAGSVGEFWTKMSSRAIPGAYSLNEPHLSCLAIRLGKALQMTNILRDFPHDLSVGRCYIPKTAFANTKVDPANITNAEEYGKMHQIISPYIIQAFDNFEAGATYLMAIRPQYFRLRLSVLWPILIGLKTLQQITHSSNWLVSHKPIKVTRWWIYRMIIFSIPIIWSNRLLSIWIRHIRRRSCNPIAADQNQFIS